MGKQGYTAEQIVNKLREADGTSEQPTTFPRFQKTAGPLRANSLVLGR